MYMFMEESIQLRDGLEKMMIALVWIICNCQISPACQGKVLWTSVSDCN